MVLFCLTAVLAQGARSPVSLPAWAYIYELPSSPTVMVNGRIVPVNENGGFGGGRGEAPAKPKPLRLGELVPGLAADLGFGIGERLNRTFIARATREKAAAGATFATKSGDAHIGYSLDDSNRIQAASYSVPVPVADSETRFAAFRTALTKRLGPPIYGRRDGDTGLTLVWSQFDSSSASLGLVADGKELGIGVFLADSQAFGGSRVSSKK